MRKNKVGLKAPSTENHCSNIHYERHLRFISDCVSIVVFHSVRWDRFGCSARVWSLPPLSHLLLQSRHLSPNATSLFPLQDAALGLNLQKNIFFCLSYPKITCFMSLKFSGFFVFLLLCALTASVQHTEELRALSAIRERHTGSGELCRDLPVTLEVPSARSSCHLLCVLFSLYCCTRLSRFLNTGQVRPPSPGPYPSVFHQVALTVSNSLSIVCVISVVQRQIFFMWPMCGNRCVEKGLGLVCQPERNNLLDSSKSMN